MKVNETLLGALTHFDVRDIDTRVGITEEAILKKERKKEGEEHIIKRYGTRSLPALSRKYTRKSHIFNSEVIVTTKVMS